MRLGSSASCLSYRARSDVTDILHQQLRQLLGIAQNQEVLFERYSDSAAAYITLDPESSQVYKTLFRAAKAKLKLRLRATFVNDGQQQTTTPLPAANANPSLTTLVEPPTASSPRPTSFVGVTPTAPQLPSVPRQPLVPRIVPTGSTPMASMDHLAAIRKQCLSKILREGEGEGEAPVPRPFPARKGKSLFEVGAASRYLPLTCPEFFAQLQNISPQRELALRLKEPQGATPCSWSVYCNACDRPMQNEHYHCSICDDGDYDLCGTCVDAGIHCPGEGHWLIKRFVQNGNVINSTTERIAPKDQPDVEPGMPGAYTDEEKKLDVDESKDEYEPTRTCNSCVNVYKESSFVTCTTCDDYDLCMTCHVGLSHGHHPAHAFKPATEDAQIGPFAELLCKAGRNLRHNAICDGCDKFIYGVRHKCLNCPDFDYCSECVKNAKFIHPTHRFVPVYEALSSPPSSYVLHHGITCDGPLCKGKDNRGYIEGIRYKCAICHDTDFCAGCEAAPSNRHNRTHPLIKFKTPVKNVSVTTMGEDKNGDHTKTMGDHPRMQHWSRRSTATETTATPSVNAATQVRTIVDVKPSEESSPKPKDKIAIKDLLAEPIIEKSAKLEEPIKPQSPKPIPASELIAHFVRDSIPDGTKMPTNHQFVQVWVMRNPGPHAWPAGCSVKYVGGDNMLNVDDSHPSSAFEIAEATESNVLAKSVQAGEEISFRVLMKSPKRVGTAISYWRLKAPDGTPFGHRLWCHIETSMPETEAATFTQPAPAAKEDPIAPEPSDFPRAARVMLEHQRKLRELLLKRAQEATTAMQSGEPSSKVQSDTAFQQAEASKKALHEYYEQLRLLKAAEEKRKELHNKAQHAEAEAQKAAEEATKAVEETKEIKIEEASTSDSKMIFPQLEKESPVSSIHETSNSTSTVAPTTTTEAVTAPSVASPSIRTSEEEFFEDAETVDDTFSDDDGFLTDEEYDILDASDEEHAA